MLLYSAKNHTLIALIGDAETPVNGQATGAGNVAAVHQQNVHDTTERTLHREAAAAAGDYPATDAATAILLPDGIAGPSAEGVPASDAAAAITTPDAVAAAASGAPAKEEAAVKAEAQEETFERDATELLDGFKDGTEDSKAEPLDLDALMAQFRQEMRDVDRNAEVDRVLWAFKLNPFEKLNLPFTATAADVKTAYRCALHQSGSTVLFLRLRKVCNDCAMMTAGR